MNTTTTTKNTTKNATKKRAPKTLSLRKLAEEQGITLESITAHKEATPTATKAEEVKPEATERELTEAQQLARQRRAALRDLSNQLKKAAELAGQDDLSVNALLRQYYAQAGHTELKTFGEWKEAGYFVRKGEKAIILWGHPRSLKADEAPADTNEAKDEQRDFYPLAYLFSNQQVNKRN